MVVRGRDIEKNKMGTIQWNIGMGIESLVYDDGSRPVKIPCSFCFYYQILIYLFLIYFFLELEYSRFIMNED